MSSTMDELLNRPRLLSQACSLAAKKRLGLGLDKDKIEVRVVGSAPNEFQVQSNLDSLYKLNQSDAHEIVNSANLSIAGRNDRIEQMEIHSAISGFSDEDLPVFDEKFAFLASAYSPTVQHERLTRVI